MRLGRHLERVAWNEPDGDYEGVDVGEGGCERGGGRFYEVELAEGYGGGVDLGRGREERRREGGLEVVKEKGSETKG